MNSSILHRMTIVFFVSPFLFLVVVFACVEILYFYLCIIIVCLSFFVSPFSCSLSVKKVFASI